MSPLPILHLYCRDRGKNQSFGTTRIHGGGRSGRVQCGGGPGTNAGCSGGPRGNGGGGARCLANLGPGWAPDLILALVELQVAFCPSLFEMLVDLAFP